jgi:hypothetical protein
LHISSRQILTHLGWGPGKTDQKIQEFAYSGVLVEIGEEASRVLTLGAGGTIKQQIEADTNDPRIWDVHNGKLLCIHFLNSAHFEAVTGLLPPPTPVTAEVYAAEGLPFYELYTEKYSSVGINSGLITIKSLGQLDAERECQPSFHYDAHNPPSCSICRRRIADCLYVAPPPICPKSLSPPF